MPARKIKRPGKTAELFAFAAALRARPGNWAPHPYRPKAVDSAASRIRNGQTAVFGTGFEARVTPTHLLVRYSPKDTTA